MEVYGNVEYIKKAIQKKYEEFHKELDKEIEEKSQEIRNDFEVKIASLREHFDTRLENTTAEHHLRILNDEKAKAKRAFEEKREALINKVFEEVTQMATKKVHTKEYIAFVNANLKGEDKTKLQAIGDDSYYKKEFPKLEIDKSIIGLKFKSGEVVIDLTINGAIKSQKDALREAIGKKLFGEA